MIFSANDLPFYTNYALCDEVESRFSVKLHIYNTYSLLCPDLSLLTDVVAFTLFYQILLLLQSAPIYLHCVSFLIDLLYGFHFKI